MHSLPTVKLTVLGMQHETDRSDEEPQEQPQLQAFLYSGRHGVHQARCSGAKLSGETGRGQANQHTVYHVLLMWCRGLLHPRQ
jgi:hypothetical protein